MANNAKLPDVKTLQQAGIDPKTRLPTKITSSAECGLQESIKAIIRTNDEQLAINRFQWYGLPKGLTGNLIERILYYRGQGMLFYMPTDEKFYFLPYALDGNIDVYGRYTAVTPVPFAGTPSSTEKDGEIKPWIKGLKRIPVYDFDPFQPVDIDLYENSCILLSDYSKPVSQTIVPKSVAVEPIIDLESKMLPYMSTALSNATGVSGVRVNSADEIYTVMEASKKINDCALNGEKWVPMASSMEFQDLSPAQVAKAEEFLLAMESIDNFRLGTYGVENGGLFQKKAHMLQTEQAMAGGGAETGCILNDSLLQRQEFCLLANNIWGLGIWCMPSENMQEQDLNMDGIVGDTKEPLIQGGEQTDAVE